MMETGFEMLDGVLVKDEEAVTVSMSVDEFIVLHYTVKSAYCEAKQNERLHKIPVPQILEDLMDIVEIKFFTMSKAEEVRCNG